MNKYLHVSAIIRAANSNYGESTGNVLSLKKLTMDGKNYTYISRQALRYNIVNQLSEYFNYSLAPTDRDKGVVQFKEDASIEDYVEIDLFGYMKTGNNMTRCGIVRLNDAISLEPFHNDMDFSNNMGMARRNGQELDNDLFQSDVHKSYYSYSLEIDLDSVGIDKNDDTTLSNEKKAERITAFLTVLKTLYRDIRGHRENLMPVFIIGGLYDCGNPFFYNRLSLDFKQNGTYINAESLNATLEVTMPPNMKTVASQTKIGIDPGRFMNSDAIMADKMSIEAFFNQLNDQVKSYYK